MDGDEQKVEQFVEVHLIIKLLIQFIRINAPFSLIIIYEVLRKKAPKHIFVDQYFTTYKRNNYALLLLPFIHIKPYVFPLIVSVSFFPI